MARERWADYLARLRAAERQQKREEREEIR